ncbi:uncharacterized protein ACJ7VT_012146 [Polymixia lowei]
MGEDDGQMEMSDLTDKEEGESYEAEEDDLPSEEEEHGSEFEEEEEDPEEGGGRKKRWIRRYRPRRRHWSLGYYGLFQLNDSYYCQSGHRQSRNVCRKHCSDFIDDDISDDVACFVKFNGWRTRRLLYTSCVHWWNYRYFFDMCE